MSIKSSVRAIKNVLQDAIIRIPYFLSAVKPTSTIAVLIEAENTEADAKYVEQILTHERGLLGYQWKLHYEKELSCKTVIIQFDTISNSEQFYAKYAKNYDKSYGLTVMQNEERTNKLLLFFCKDLTNSSSNMSEILYSLGRICVQLP